MPNELRTICDLLDGYTEERRFEVLAATRTPDGRWELTIKKAGCEAEKTNQEEVAGNVNE